MLLKSRPQFYALSKNNHELFLKDELFETTHFIADTLVRQKYNNSLLKNKNIQIYIIDRDSLFRVTIKIVIFFERLNK